MTVTIASFRNNYPEFSDVIGYPDSSVNYWLNLAGLTFNAQKWGALLDHGSELYIAHNLVLEFRAQAEALNGAAPGVTTGPVNSKSTDKVSVGFDTGSAVEKDGGHWNTTIYGTRYLRLVRIFGAGPVQVGVSFNVDPLSSANAWFGPVTTPGFSNN